MILLLKFGLLVYFHSFTPGLDVLSATLHIRLNNDFMENFKGEIYKGGRFLEINVENILETEYADNNFNSKIN